MSWELIINPECLFIYKEHQSRRRLNREHINPLKFDTFVINIFRDTAESIRWALNVLKGDDLWANWDYWNDVNNIDVDFGMPIKSRPDIQFQTHRFLSLCAFHRQQTQKREVFKYRFFFLAQIFCLPHIRCTSHVNFFVNIIYLFHFLYEY